MTNFKKQAFAAVTTIALFANVAGSAFAATNLEISGNGRDSDNNVNVSNTSTTSVVQNNTANVDNNIKVTSDTGNNKANDNSGNVTVRSGNANVTAVVKNDLNQNAAQLNCCSTGSTDVKISGNLRDSDNTVNLTKDNSKAVYQTNDAHVNNNVDVTSKTGNNRANDNLGGTVDVHSGDAISTVGVSTAANTNIVRVGGGNSEGGNGNVSARIIGNGRNSDNDLNLTMDKALNLVQNNNADVYNNVDVHSTTGYNNANDNSGDVTVRSGLADTWVGVDNAVNFNAASVDCGCLMGDVMAKIGGNGRNSESDLTASFNDTRAVFQTNTSNLNNDVYAAGKTGNNHANDNLSGAAADPTVHSGASVSTLGVTNAGNKNTLGTSFVMPGTGSSVNLTWNWASMMAFFGMNM